MVEVRLIVYKSNTFVLWMGLLCSCDNLQHDGADIIFGERLKDFAGGT
jgi:hypothetical protein